MKAIISTGLGRRTALKLAEVAQPEPGPDDVLVAVHASSVNPKDWKLNATLGALMPPVGPLKRPLFGDDLSGVVVACGKRVKDIEVGEAVYGMDMRLRTNACAEFAVINPARIARKPVNLSHEEAAAVPLAAQTALQAFRKARVAAGCRLLIIGASGGVGTFAVQIARLLGAQVTGVCSERNRELVLSLGADKVIDYTREDFLSGPACYDVIFDATSFESPVSCAGILTPEGIFVSTGGYAAAYLNVARARLASRMSQRSRQQARLVVVESHTRDLDTLTAWIENGSLHPVIDSRYPLADLADAYAHSMAGRARGKIVISIKH